MSVWKYVRIPASLLLGAALTAGVYQVEHRDRVRRETELGLRLAQQITKQAEGLYLHARTRQERDPLGWAVSFLALGTEQKSIQVTALRDSASSQLPARHSFNPQTGVLDYVSFVHPQSGHGVRVVLKLEYPGFLGMGTKARSDLALAAVATLFALLLMSRYLRGAQSSETGAADERSTATPFLATQPASAHVNSEKELRKKVNHWVKDAKKVFDEVGTQMELMHQEIDLIKDAQAQLPSDLEAIKKTSEALSMTPKYIARAEAIALNLVMVGRKFGPNGKPFADIATKLHATIRDLNQIYKAHDERIKAFETHLAPLMDNPIVTDTLREKTQQLTETLQEELKKLG